MANQVEPLRAKNLAEIPHGFFGSWGGVSHGAVTGLNIGFGADDDPRSVIRNREMVVEAVLPGAQLHIPYQIHSPDVVVVQEAWADGERPEGDALVTDRPGLLLGIVTADCAPVLFADRKAGVVGAAHAGWRGAFDGVVEQTVAAMERLGASPANIAATIGPCIAQRSYEVDERFRKQFADEDARFFAPGKPGHYQFDVPAYVRHRLERAGVGAIGNLAQDTYSQPDRFYSYRRATHEGASTNGRQVSVIGLGE